MLTNWQASQGSIDEPWDAQEPVDVGGHRVLGDAVEEAGDGAVVEDLVLTLIS